MLTVIASACRDHERLRFDYRAHSGADQPALGGALPPGQRPAALVPGGLGHGPGRLAYLPGRPDRAADADRTALHAPCATARRRDRRTGGPRGRRGDLAVPGTGDRARARRPTCGLGCPIPVEVESLGDDRCAFEPGSDHPQMLALYLGLLDADFEIVDSPELVDALRELAGRYQRAIDASPHASGSGV